MLTLLLAGYLIFSKIHLNLLAAYFYLSYLSKNGLQDTFRGRVCECPVVQGVKFSGDGYTHCEGKVTASFPKMVSNYHFNYPNSRNSCCFFFFFVVFIALCIYFEP